MVDPETLAQRSRANGHSDDAEVAVDGSAGEQGDGDGGGGGLVGSLLGAGRSLLGAGADLATGAAGRITGAMGQRLQADFDDRDPDFIREQLPLQWLISSIWFRGEVRGLANVPEQGPVLLVGNHSGGNLTPDTIVFGLAFQAYFGVERRFHQLVHNLVLALPQTQLLRLPRFGAVTASREHALQALREGAALLVYPGGDWEVHRPSWQGAKVDFDGRRGFVELAIEADVPIVPVVSIGGQETALFLSRGEWLARLSGVNRLLRLKVMPISLALPWGLNIGDFAGHIPLPAKLTIEALAPIHIRDRFGADPDPGEVYEHVISTMQTKLEALAAERRFPVIG